LDTPTKTILQEEEEEEEEEEDIDHLTYYHLDVVMIQII